MATAETIAPVIRTVNIKPSNKCQPFDPALLSRKLEAARREQDAANTRRERRAATRNGTFVARSATHSSDSSSTPPPFPSTAQKQPSTTTQVPDLPPPAPTEVQSTADGRSVMTHKSMFAALNLGLADLEVMTNKLERETSQQREYLCSRCKSSNPSEANEYSHDSTHLPSTTTASRNYSRRRSMPLTSAASHSRLVPIKHGSQTVYERVDIPSDDPPEYQYHALSYEQDPPLNRTHAQRPPLIRPHDRPDWTQQSQCGDAETNSNPFSVPSGYIFRRRTAAQSDVAPASKTAGNLLSSSSPPPRPSQEGHLISDAVKLIKARERRAKARSVVEFLRRL